MAPRRTHHEPGKSETRSAPAFSRLAGGPGGDRLAPRSAGCRGGDGALVPELLSAKSGGRVPTVGAGLHRSGRTAQTPQPGAVGALEGGDPLVLAGGATPRPGSDRRRSSVGLEGGRVHLEDSGGSCRAQSGQSQQRGLGGKAAAPAADQALFLSYGTNRCSCRGAWSGSIRRPEGSGRGSGCGRAGS